LAATHEFFVAQLFNRFPNSAQTTPFSIM